MVNLITDWIGSDGKLAEILHCIDEEVADEKTAAEKAFYKIGNYLQLPLQPEDIIDKDYAEHESLGLEPRDVFTELALINFLFSDEDIKGNVIQALYNVYHGQYFDFDNAAAIIYGDEKKIPNRYEIYLWGDTIDARLSFSLPSNQPFTQSGAKCKLLIIKNSA